MAVTADAPLTHGDGIRGVLTTRGRAFVAAGLTLALGGLGFGFADLTRVGVLLAGLPLLAALISRRARPTLVVTRVVQPAPLAVDQEASVLLEVHNPGPRMSPLLVSREQVDHVLGDGPRFVLPRMDAGERRQVHYSIRSSVRGRHGLGPLRVRAGDAFGLSTSSSTAGSAGEVLVLPRVEPLGSGRPRGDGVGAEGAVPHMVALHGEDDVSIREYRDGDDLRRIHWPATARQGELMVRQEDRPARRRAVLLLDSRSGAHAGRDSIGSFEWAVSALASVATHLSEDGYAVHLVSSEAIRNGLAGEMLDLSVVLESLAVAEPGGSTSFDQVLHAASPLTSAGGLVIAVATDHDEAALRALAALRQPGGTGLLLLLETATFATGKLRHRLPTGHRDATQPRERTAALADLVRGAGWSVAVVRAGEGVATAWTAATARGAVLAGAR